MQELLRQRDSIRVDDRFQSALLYVCDKLHYVRIEEGVAARYRDAIGFSDGLEEIQLVLHFFKSLVRILDILSIASVTVQVTLSRRLQPGYAVVGHCPRQPVQLSRIDNQFVHEKLLFSI